ncbi:MAG: DNA alkylation repair protein [Lachnospiraceae bacterium]|nr:DNA alkylation repair protein [Lachnospiraceae bacterium]
MTVIERLKKCGNEKYRDFQSKLVPNIDKDTIIGVKTPDMRRIAKEIKGTSEAQEFLRELPHKYYEENLVHFFLISMIKDFDECVSEVERFLPFIDCWPVSDQSSPKVFAKHHDRLPGIIKSWIDSEHVYTARFGIRILMNEFLGEDFNEEYLEWVANKRETYYSGEVSGKETQSAENRPQGGDDYYIKMMIAWYFATALAKRYDESVVFIEEKRLDAWTHNKAIQKAIESFRVTDEHKAYLRTLKR